MKTIVYASVLAVATVSAQSIQSAYGQCGGSSYTGASICTAGYTCSTQSGGYYAQCTPGTGMSFPYHQTFSILRFLQFVEARHRGLICVRANPFP